MAGSALWQLPLQQHVSRASGPYMSPPSLNKPPTANSLSNKSKPLNLPPVNFGGGVRKGPLHAPFIQDEEREIGPDRELLSPIN